MRNPNLSQADLWTLAGASAVEFLGGPAVPHKLGRGDAPMGTATPPNGRLPDASQGAQVRPCLASRAAAANIVSALARRFLPHGLQRQRHRCAQVSRSIVRVFVHCNNAMRLFCSGAHTLGRCHLVRSGFDGKWTANPLVFDNSYFRVWSL